MVWFTVRSFRIHRMAEIFHAQFCKWKQKQSRKMCFLFVGLRCAVVKYAHKYISILKIDFQCVIKFKTQTMCATIWREAANMMFYRMTRSKKNIPSIWKCRRNDSSLVVRNQHINIHILTYTSTSIISAAVISSNRFRVVQENMLISLFTADGYCEVNKFRWCLLATIIPMNRGINDYYYSSSYAFLPLSFTLGRYFRREIYLYNNFSFVGVVARC